MTEAHAAYVRKKARTITKKTVVYFFLILISIIWLFPYAYLICRSFAKSYSPTDFFARDFTFQNYVNLFTDKAYPFWRWFLNTLIVAIINMFLTTLFTLMTAYALSRLRFKGRKGLMQFMLILGMFPGFLGMVATLGTLSFIHLDGPHTAIFGLTLVYVAGSAMNYYIAKGFFDTIPKSLDEAVLIDGGSKNTVFWKIILPLSKPIIVYTLLMSFTSPWGDYMMASYIASGQDSAMNVAVGLRNMITIVNWQPHFNTFCAGAIVTSIPIMVLFFFLQKYYVEGVTGGAVKG